MKDIGNPFIYRNTNTTKSDQTNIVDINKRNLELFNKYADFHIAHGEIPLIDYDEFCEALKEFKKRRTINKLKKIIELMKER